MKIWKKNAVLAIVILFVCVAVYLNWSYGRGEAAAGSAAGDTATGDEVTMGDTQQVGADDASKSNSDLVSLEGDSDIAQASAESDYFDKARLTRQQTRDSSLEILKDSAGDEKQPKDARDKAAKDLNTLANNAMAEAQIESLVIAKGYRDCVAFINNGAIDVVVSSTESGLAPEDVSKIKDIVVDKTGITTDSIKIIEVSE